MCGEMSKDKSEFILGKVEAKYKWQQLNNSLDLSGAVDTDGLLKGEIGLVHASLPNLKVVIKPQAGKTTEVSAGLEFQNTNLSTAATVLYRPTGDLVATGSFLAGATKGIHVGLESAFAFSRAPSTKVPPGLESIKALANVKKDSLEFTLYAKQAWNVEGKEGAPLIAQKKTVGGFYEHRPTIFTTLHSTFEWDSTGADPFAFQFGAIYKVDSDTTVQGKLDQQCKLTVHLAKQLTPHVKGTITTEFNALEFAANNKLAVGVIYK